MSTEQIAWKEPQTPKQIVDEAIGRGYDRFYVLYSGGQDSGCIAHYIAENYPDKFKAVLHADTGVSLKQTRQFVHDYCAEQGWPLIITKAPNRKRGHGMFGDSFTFEEFVLEDGFPGPHNHRHVMGFLKYFGWREFMIKTLDRDGPGACFISGVRKKESTVRNKFRQYTKKKINKDGRLVFVLPFLFKNGVQTSRYFFEYGLKKSPAYELGFGISGECLCGAFADPWERLLIQRNDPELYEYLVNLEEKVKREGTALAKHNVKWGQALPVARNKKKTKDEFQTLLCEESCVVSE